MVKVRIKQFCESQGITVSAFEKSIGVANGYVNSISKSIGIEKICRILEKYPILDLEWLLTGKGDMLRVDSAQTSSGDNSPNIQGNSNNIHICDNAVMEERIKSLEALLAEKERIIQIYEQISKK